MFNTYTEKTVKQKMVTYENGEAKLRTAKEELALTVLGSYLNVDNFYEGKNDRVKRIINLVSKVDSKFIDNLAVVARQEFNHRTSPVVLLAIKTLKTNHKLSDKVINNVMVRGDEVTEYLAAVKALSNKNIVTPSAKKVAAVALRRLTERSALRYSGGSKAWSLSDVIRMTHPTPINEAQSALFKFIVQKDKQGSLTKAWETLSENEKISLPLVQKSVQGTDGATVSWERAKSSGYSDWTYLIKDMNYMAILRNLRNFLKEVDHGNEEFWSIVKEKISDKSEVLRSKQMPYRFYSAYNAIPSNNRRSIEVKAAVATALNYSAYNVPSIEGKTIVMVDTSASMESSISSRGRNGSVEGVDITYADLSRVLGASAAISHGATLVSFASTAKVIPVSHDVMSTLGSIITGEVGHSTVPSSVTKVVNIKEYDNIIIFTDGQFSETSMFSNFRGKVFFVDLTGYRPGFVVRNNVVTIGGWSDAALKLISVSSQGDIVNFIENYKY